MELNTVKLADCIEYMRGVPTESVDIVVTSPPYNLRNTTGGGVKSKAKKGYWRGSLAKGYSCFSDNLPYNQYVAWQRAALAEMVRVIKPTGAVFYNHKWRVQGGLIQDRREIVEGFPVRQIIIWKRAGGTNFNPGYFLPTYEVIYLIAKPGFKLAKGGPGLTDVWTFAQDKNNPHPAPFPVELPRRCIKATGARTVLDPFMGSGSTAVAAIEAGIDFLGCDNSPEYVELATTRINLAPVVSSNEETIITEGV